MEIWCTDWRYLKPKTLPSAEDLYHEVFVKLVQEERRFENEEHLKAWLIRVTVNSSHKLFRASWMRRTVPLDELSQVPLQTTDFTEQSEGYEAVMALPRKYRTAIHLYYYEGYSLEEIVKILHQKSSTTRSQLYRARNLLKTRLEGIEHHEKEYEGDV